MTGFAAKLQPKNSLQINDLGGNGWRGVFVGKPARDDVLVLSQIWERVVGVGVCGRPDE